MKGILLVRTVVGVAILNYLANSRAFIRPHPISSSQKSLVHNADATLFVYVNQRKISGYNCLKNKCLHIYCSEGSSFGPLSKCTNITVLCYLEKGNMVSREFALTLD